MTHTERMEELVEAERAVEWLQRLESGGPEVHAEFGRWLRQSPRHAREVLFASALRHALRHLNAHHPVNVAELKARALSSLVELPLIDRDALSGLPERQSSREQAGPARTSHPRNLRGWRAAGLALFVLVALATVAIYGTLDRTISTAAGEWRSTRLDDGSLLRTGPRTSVRIDFSDRRRVVRLARGEIMVYVEPDPQRPFYVDTGIATARAVGTAFAVRRTEHGRASITVEQGTVAVARGRVFDSNRRPAATVMVMAGEGMSIANDNRPLAPRAVDVQKDLAWVHERLIFGDMSTVAEAIRELNLRNRTQIKLLDRELGDRAVRGTFSASDPEAFARTLEALLPIKVVERDDALLLVPNPARG